jgi:AcrR family transcriptional regulator
MGRPALISDADLLAAATRVAARLGPGRATVALIAHEAGVPVGSVYHRVPSRARLLADIWIAAAGRYSAEFLERLAAAASLDAAADTALVTPRFVRADHAAGVLLLAHRRDDFLEEAPEEARDRAARLAATLQTGLAGAAARLLPGDARGRERLAVALIGVPYGAVRVFLPQAMPPAELDPTIRAAARAALGH